MVVALSVAHLLLTVLVVAIRVWSVVTRGVWVETTGFESTGLNVIAYTQHHWPPYRDLSTHVTTAIFNVGFYGVYAAAASAVDGSSVPILLSLRLMTFCLVIGGAVVLAVWIQRQLPAALGVSPRWILAASIAAGSLLGPFVGWWPLTVRPDGAVIVFETLGLLAAVEAARSGRRGGAWASTFLFACALSFKQTEIAVFGTVVAAWLLSGRRQETIGGVIAIALVAGAGFWMSGPFYTENIVRAAAAAKYSLANGLRETAPAIVTGFTVFAPALLIVMRGTTRRDPVFPVYLVFLICGAVGLVELTRLGASRNYLFPSYMAGVIIIVNRLSVPDAWTASTIRVIAAMLVASLALQSTYLVLPNTFGRITFDDVDIGAGQARRMAMARAAEPVLIEEGLDAVPWHSGHADTESIDWIIYDTAVGQGTIRRSVESRIAAREYASAFSRRNFQSALVAAGYRPVTAFGDGTVQYERSRTK